MPDVTLHTTGILKTVPCTYFVSTLSSKSSTFLLSLQRSFPHLPFTLWSHWQVIKQYIKRNAWFIFTSSLLISKSPTVSSEHSTLLVEFLPLMKQFLKVTHYVLWHGREKVKGGCKDKLAIIFCKNNPLFTK